MPVVVSRFKEDQEEWNYQKYGSVDGGLRASISGSMINLHRVTEVNRKRSISALEEMELNDVEEEEGLDDVMGVDKQNYVISVQNSS